jgi:hypothetical protein
MVFSWGSSLEARDAETEAEAAHPEAVGVLSYRTVVAAVEEAADLSYRSSAPTWVLPEPGKEKPVRVRNEMWGWESQQDAEVQGRAPPEARGALAQALRRAPP